MSVLNTIVLSACSVSLIIGILRMIVPGSKYERQIQIFMSCLMLLAILAPIVESVRTFSPQMYVTDAANESANDLIHVADEQVLALAQDEVAAALQQELAQQAIPCSRLSVVMHIDEESRISISSVTVVSTKPQQAETALRQYFGKDVEIYAASTP